MLYVVFIKKKQALSNFGECSKSQRNNNLREMKKSSRNLREMKATCRNLRECEKNFQKSQRNNNLREMKASSRNLRESDIQKSQRIRVKRSLEFHTLKDC